MFVQEVFKMTKNVDNSLKNQVIAMSNTLAEKSTRFTVFQQRLFYVSLASLKLNKNSTKTDEKLEKKERNEVKINKQELFEYLSITKEVYVNKNGNFNRTLFERKTVNRAVKEINEKSKCIQKLRYEKVKKGNRVQYYLFTFNYTDPQKVVEDARTDKRWEQLSLLDDIPTVEKPVRVPDDVKDYKWWE